MRRVLAIWIALAVAAAVPAQESPGFQKLWDHEQQARGAYNKVMYDERSTPDQVKKAIADALAVMKMTRESEYDSATDFLGLRAFVYQRNDISVDLLVGYARLKDKASFLAQLDALIELIGDLPTKPAPNPKIYDIYYQALTGRSLIRPMLKDPDVDKRMEILASRSADRRFLQLPYSTDDVEMVSEGDRIMAISMIYSEAKYNFANWDLVKTLNWDRAYAHALEQGRKAKDRYAFYNVLREFVGLLSDSHTDVSLPASLRSTKEVGLGIRARLIGNDVIVTEDSPLGLKRGDVVETIDGEPAKAYGEKRWGKYFRESTPQYRLVRIYTYMLWRGVKDSKAVLGVRRANGEKRTVTAVRDGKPLLAPLPSSSFRLLPDGTAYFGFNTCEDYAVVEAFRKALPDIQKAGRLVIDVRENGGGDSSVGWEILRHFIDKEMPTSQWQTPQYRAAFRPWGRIQEPYKGSPESNYKLKPHEARFEGKVAILMGPKTFSAAEDFAGSARSFCRLFGEATGGSSGQPHWFALPGGGSVRMCAKRDRLPDGTEFVGVGIQPHERVAPTAADFAAGRDPALDAALAWLKG